MPEQILYLVRHGETTWNREGRMQGQGDSPLTERGIEQARRIGRTLERLLDGRMPAVMVTSPLGRARRKPWNRPLMAWGLLGGLTFREWIPLGRGS